MTQIVTRKNSRIVDIPFPAIHNGIQHDFRLFSQFGIEAADSSIVSLVKLRQRFADGFLRHCVGIDPAKLFRRNGLFAGRPLTRLSGTHAIRLFIRFRSEKVEKSFQHHWEEIGKLGFYAIFICFR